LKRLVYLLCLGLSSGCVRADVKLPALFGDHMVLQQDAQLPVWGTADPAESVTVEVGDEKTNATAGADGKWMVKLPPLPAGTTPLTLTVTGKNTLKFEDVLPGDVWLCGGQSNMEFSLGGAHNAKDVIPESADPQLRIFLVKPTVALQPATDVEGKWEVAGPATVGKFSGVGYFFGRELRTKLQRPIGLIGSYYGGTPAQAWVSESGLKQEPRLKGYVDAYEKTLAAYPQAMKDYPAQMDAFNADLAKWNQTYGDAFQAAEKQWHQDVAAARAANQVPPEEPRPPTPAPRPPVAPDGGKGAPVGLFDGMIAPLIPYALKGVVWYQGESNSGNADEYSVLFPRLIADWREKWGQGDFPFIYVQLAKFNLSWLHNDSNWARLREAQLKTLSVPHTGMAVAFDVGDPHNIHPIDKLDVGQRLALVARHVAYGEDLVYSGPLYDSMKVAGGEITLSFTQVGGGLIIGKAPWLALGMHPIPDTTLVGFKIAGDDKTWYPADAKIDGNTVVVSSAQVPNPVAVRYAWGNAPDANLYNRDGLPASPFRTDDWPETVPPPAWVATP
jgi:sialate O-acetylesterase